jgi:hypothetical protein
MDLFNRQKELMVPLGLRPALSVKVTTLGKIEWQN